MFTQSKKPRTDDNPPRRTNMICELRKRKAGKAQTDLQLPKKIRTDKFIQVSEKGTIDRFFSAPPQVEHPPENIPPSLENRNGNPRGC
eukprot:14766342-Heterocapsa_arctica.AAC.1